MYFISSAGFTCTSIVELVDARVELVSRDVVAETPFRVQEEVDLLLTEALAQFNRDDLLGKSIHYGATLAPVYTADELRERGITRPGTFNDNQVANLPFNIISRENPTETGNESLVEISH